MPPSALYGHGCYAIATALDERTVSVLYYQSFSLPSNASLTSRLTAAEGTTFK